MKKFLATLLIVAMTVLTLAGCGKQETPTKPAENKPADKTEADANNGGTEKNQFADVNYTLKLVTTGWEVQDDQEAVQKAISDKFAELGYPGLGVEVIGFSWADFDAGKMSTFVTSGEDYDVLWCPDWVNFWNEAYQGGAFQPWDPYLDLVPAYGEMVAPYKDFIGKVDPEADESDETTYVYRVPTFKEFTNTQCAMRFNLDAARDLGIEEELRNIKDVNDLDPYLQMFLDKYPDRMPVLATDTGNLRGFFNGGVDSNPFAPVYSPEKDAYIIGVFEDWFKEYENTLHRWVDAGFIPEYEVTGNTQDLMQKFGAESFLVYFNSGKPGLEAELNLNAAADGHEWGVTSLVQDTVELGSIMGNPYALNAKSKNPEAAAFIYEMLCTNADLNNLLNFGVQGVHYNLDADGTLQKVENSGYYPGIMAWLGNRLLCHRLPGEPEGGVGPLYQECNDNAVTLKNFGFPGPMAEFRDDSVWDVYWGVHGAVWDQYNRAMETGRLTDADIETIQKQLLDGGAESVLNTYNKSYEKWSSEK